GAREAAAVHHRRVRHRVRLRRAVHPLRRPRRHLRRSEPPDPAAALPGGPLGHPGPGAVGVHAGGNGRAARAAVAVAPLALCGHPRLRPREPPRRRSPGPRVQRALWLFLLTPEYAVRYVITRTHTTYT